MNELDLDDDELDEDLDDELNGAGDVTFADAADDSSPDLVDSEALIRGRRITIVGRLGGMNRREAANLLRSYGAVMIESDSAAVDWIVIGAEESPLAEAELIEEATRRRGLPSQSQILHETELWQRLGLVDSEHSIRKLHTPAMLAHLLGVSVRVIRRWHRLGLIKPVRTLHRLPYFDFQEVATARRLAAWVASGASPEAIERRLLQLIEIVPELRRPLDQLSILVEGKHVLLRQGEGLIEPGGQLRFDFDHLGQSADGVNSPQKDQDPTVSIRFPGMGSSDSLAFPPLDPTGLDNEGDDELLMSAYAAEDAGDFSSAIDCYHALLARDGSRADWHFQIGELLYRMGEIMAARERYYAAIEVDPDFVEARSSLAGVLAETNQLELAVAAYQGTLALHDDYCDVRYNLARLLDQLGRPLEAEQHWLRFLELAPRSPWADEARGRLESRDDETP